MTHKQRQKLRIVSAAIFFLLIAFSYMLIQLSLEKRASSKTTKWTPTPLDKAADSTKVYFGVYSLSITDLDLGSSSFQYDGYMWVRYKGFTGDSLMNEIELMNRGKDVSMVAVDTRDSSQFKYVAYRIQGTIATTYSLAHFPFDTQILTLEFESPIFEKNKFVFIPDTASFAQYDSGFVGLEHNLNVPDYDVINSQIYVTDHTYPTDFGLPETGVGRSLFTRAVFEVHVQRKFMPYLTKFLLPIFLMLAVTYLVFFIPPDQLEISIVICATSLFTAIGIGLLQLEISMHIGYLMTTDKFYVLSYIVIVFAFIETIVASNAAEKDMQMANLIHAWSRYIFYPLCGVGLFLIGLWDYITP